MRQRPDADGIYVLAAAVLLSDDRDRVRDELVGLRHGKRRFHWRMEEPRAQMHAVRTVGAIDLMHLAVVGRRLDSTRQERGSSTPVTSLWWTRCAREAPWDQG